MSRQPLHTYDEPRERRAHDNPTDQRTHDRGATVIVAAMRRGHRTRVVSGARSRRMMRKRPLRSPACSGLVPLHESAASRGDARVQTRLEAVEA